MEFCTMCANMLYVKQHPQDPARLLFYCKNCQFSKEHDADRPYVLSQKKMDTSSYSMFIHPYIQYDATLPHVNTLPCPSPDCTRPKEADQDVVYMKYDYENMAYVYHCTHCGHFWTLDGAATRKVGGSAAAGGGGAVSTLLTESATDLKKNESSE